MIRHLLLIKFKESIENYKIDRIRLLFETMPNKIEGVVSVEWGINDSPEGKNQGYTHCVLMTFADDKARQHYLPHPEHELLKDEFLPVMDDIVVFDYQL